MAAWFLAQADALDGISSQVGKKSAPEPDAPPPEFESVKVAARIIGCSTGTLRRAASEGLLGQSYKLSPRKWLVDMDAARLWAKTPGAW